MNQGNLLLETANGILITLTFIHLLLISFSLDSENDIRERQIRI